ncbi:helix-turn-helix domain-containing protein [Nonomuraea aurantiaca]|uniref:helix-turn-helix domain-containing protein n=1 Tax=Nonomuraea aurantiaca TaxID=2878562 RepID=UPI001CD954D1|nr:helix-turn-helix domain-containing protein [Nonomuraea aurantiaca]MCA2225170.1 helix-turn-helix domain-containing protein [Nonomuraea aurantiaca]
MSVDETPRTLADKLNRLFQTVRRQGDAEYSNVAVAEAISKGQDVQISHTYIWQLRTGRRVNPTIMHLTALATFFGVPVAYFLNDAETAKIDKDLELLAGMRKAGVTHIALRSAELTQGSRAAIIEMVNQLWKLENPSDEDAR